MKSIEEYLTFYEQLEESKAKTLKDKIARLKLKNDELIFVVGGDEYKKYIHWRHDIETKINRQELETGQRAIDGEKLSDQNLDQVRKSLENRNPKVNYGGYLFHSFGGHDFRFHINSKTYSITVFNKLTKDEIKLGGSYFYTFADFYECEKRLYSEIKLSIIERLIQTFLGTKADDYSSDFDIYDKWIRLTESNRTENEEEGKIQFKINSKQYKKFLEWKKENEVQKYYFGFEEVTFASLDSAVDKLTGKSIDLTEVENW